MIRKIAFLGNFTVDYSSESHYKKTLEFMGIEVVPLQEGTATAQEVLNAAMASDMLFWVHSHNCPTPGIAEMLEILKEEGKPTVGYHLDLWLGIDRQSDLENDPYWNIEYFFTVDKLMADFMNEREDFPKAFYLPAGVFAEEAYMSKVIKPEYQHDVVFVGARGYHHEWSYRQQLINWLDETYGKRFAHYDHGHVPKMRGKNLNDLYANAKIVIGDTLCKGFDYPYYLSDRIFETIGRGGFIIHPYIKGLEDLFQLPTLLTMDGTMLNTKEAELITYPYGQFGYLKYVIDYYLQNEAEREEIRKRGHERVLADHTYFNRMESILQTITSETR